MGNTSTKEPHSPSASRFEQNISSQNSPPGSTSTNSHSSSLFRHASNSSTTAPNCSTGGRRHRHDIPFLGLGYNGNDRDQSRSEVIETRSEREARKLQKELATRQREREISMKSETVDGGYLVTLGTYTGTEDFNKNIVRQLIIERRLAPFWRGLHDHCNTWTEHQLTAAARGLPIPQADEIPQEDSLEPTSSTQDTYPKIEVQSSGYSTNIGPSTTFNSQEPFDNASPWESSSASPPQSPYPLPCSSNTPPPPFFRNRSKTLAAVSLSRNSCDNDMLPTEIKLPDEPYINGQRLEAFLYKNAEECPICFLYYPPYFNRTRCCDQPICTECFVQIKRLDPHPPEHGTSDVTGLEPSSSSVTSANVGSDYQLISEPACCPFCAVSDFGVIYEPPPFRRGFVYVNQIGQTSPRSTPDIPDKTKGDPNTVNNSDDSTSGGRRRATSISASASQVITTDKIRPDWSKKLNEARTHALRRAAAATALHNAAYVLRQTSGSQESRLLFGRRRRPILGLDNRANATHISGPTVPRSRSSTSELFPTRNQSSRSRVEDIEELMMMEAIRLSLAAEEDRKRREQELHGSDLINETPEADHFGQLFDVDQLSDMEGSSALNFTETGHSHDEESLTEQVISSRAAALCSSSELHEFSHNTEEPVRSLQNISNVPVEQCGHNTTRPSEINFEVASERYREAGEFKSVESLGVGSSSSNSGAPLSPFSASIPFHVSLNSLGNKTLMGNGNLGVLASNDEGLSSAEAGQTFTRCTLSKAQDLCKSHEVTEHEIAQVSDTEDTVSQRYCS